MAPNENDFKKKNYQRIEKNDFKYVQTISVFEKTEIYSKEWKQRDEWNDEVNLWKLR